MTECISISKHALINIVILITILSPSPVSVVRYNRCFKSIYTVQRCSLLYVFAFQSESTIVKERELSLELARIRDEVGKWDTA